EQPLLQSPPHQRPPANRPHGSFRRGTRDRHTGDRRQRHCRGNPPDGRIGHHVPGATPPSPSGGLDLPMARARRPSRGRRRRRRTHRQPRRMASTRSDRTVERGSHRVRAVGSPTHRCHRPRDRRLGRVGSGCGTTGGLSAPRRPSRHRPSRQQERL
ncbi:uncharacterized protein METZ01_LOCUS334094, partial [marine metagenome]